MENNTLTKQYDWFLATTENPNMSFDDFSALGITVENTALRDKNFYENNEYVRTLFTDSEGNFDKHTFDTVYTNVARSYLIYATKLYESGALGDLEFDPYNGLRPNDSKVYTPKMELVREVNPLGKAKGFTGLGSIGPAVRSAHESAQMSKVFDWETKLFRDYSPNDVALENSVLGWINSISDPLVMATWSEDGYHQDPFTGEKVKHAKGEYKVNDEGRYYYETLGGRSAYGKQFKSVLDNITVDGSTLNGYDFFDSDGLDKTVTGTIMKTAVTIAPLFTPAASYYAWAMIGSEMLDLLPTVYEATVGNFSEDTVPALNYIQGIGKSLKSNTTEYAKEHIMATENLGKIISDVALLWQLFRVIPQAYNKIVGTSKIQKLVAQEAEAMASASMAKKIETGRLLTGVDDVAAYLREVTNAFNVLSKTKLEPLLKANNRTGANIALGYMSLLQSTQTYEDAINLGLTKSEAAAIGIGTAMGVYAVGRSGLGELFFPELQNTNLKVYRTAISKLQQSIQQGINNLAPMPKLKKLLSLMEVGKKASSKFWQDVKDHSLGFVGKSIGEGIEEVSEEGVSDFFKAAYNLASDLGYSRTEGKLFDFDHTLERYTMSFVGGSIGGAVFGATDLVNHLNSSESTKQELVYLLRNGRKEDLLSELDTLRKRGKLGNTLLSVKYTQDADNPEVRYFQTAETEKESQNTFIHDKIKNYIEAVDLAINQEEINLSDADVLDKLANADERLKAVLEVIGKDGVNGRYLQRFNTLTSDIISLKAKIEQFELQTPDSLKLGDNKEQHLKNLKLEQELYNTIKQELDDFFSDDNVIEYADKLLFEINSKVNSVFYNANIQQYVEALSGKHISQLSDELLQFYKSKYDTYKKAAIKDRFDDAYAIYKHITETLASDINANNDAFTEYEKMRIFVLLEMIDPLKTAGKFSEHESLEDLLLYAVYNQFDLSELLNEEFYPRMKALPEGFTPELEQEALEEYTSKLQQAMLKIKDTIAKLKQIGFIDSYTRELLLSAVPKIDIGKYMALDDIKNVFTQLYQSGLRIYDSNSNTLQVEVDEENHVVLYAFDLDIWEEVWLEIQKELSKFKEGNEQSVILEISNIFQEALLRPQSVTMDSNFDLSAVLSGSQKHYNPDTLYIDESGNIHADKTIENSSQTWYGRRVASIVNAISAQFAELSSIKLKNEIMSELSTVQTSPVYELLLKLSVSINGAHSSVIDLILKKEQEITLDTLSDFKLDSVVESEIESALNLVEILESSINAAETDPFGRLEVFGHNAVINEFSKRLGKGVEYGIISTANANVMKDNLYLVLRKLMLLRHISRMNQANSFKEQEATGKITTKLLTGVLKCANNFLGLSSVEIEGMKLFDGVIDYPTPETDKEGELSDDVYIENAKVAMQLNSNYRKILAHALGSGKSAELVAQETVQQLCRALGITDTVDQTTSELNSKTDKLTEYDALMYLMATLTVDPIEWNLFLKDNIEKGSSKIVPLFPQELTSFVASSLVKNNIIFSALLNHLETLLDGKSRILQVLHNWLICSGVGGAGKTSVVGKLIYEFALKLDPKTIFWNVGPTETLVDNLNKSLPSKKSFTIEKLVETVLGTDLYTKLKNALDSNSDCENFYTVDKSQPEAYVNVKISDKVTFTKIDTPKVLFIDECTYVNTVYAKILSKWAKSNGVLIFGLGDNKQSGHYSKQINLFNVGQAIAISGRTPELNISMRAANIHKKANNNVLSSLLTVVNKLANRDQSTDVEMLKELLELLHLKYFETEKGVIKGDVLVDSISKEKLELLINNSESFIYIYDSVSSKTYKIVLDLRAKFPDKVQMYTPTQVQGREADLVLVDVDFSKYSSEQADSLRSLNTLLTRALEGTTIIDNGFKSFLPNCTFDIQSYYTDSPDPSTIVAKYNENKLKIIDRILKEVPALVEQVPEPGNKPNGPEKSKSELEKAVELFIEEVNNSELEDEDKEEFVQRASSVKSTDDLDTLRSELQAAKDEVAEFNELSKRLNELITTFNQSASILNDSVRDALAEEIYKAEEMLDDNTIPFSAVSELISLALGKLHQALNINEPVILTEDDVNFIEDVVGLIDDSGKVPPTVESLLETPIQSGWARAYTFVNDTGVTIEGDQVSIIPNPIPDARFDLAIWLSEGTNQPDMINLAKELHSTITSVIRHNGSNLEYLIECLDQDFKRLGYSSIPEPLKEAIRKGKFKLLAQNLDGNRIIKLVFNYQFNQKDNYVTIAYLADPNTWSAHITKTDPNNTEALDEVRKYGAWYSKFTQDLNSENSYRIVDLNGDIVSTQYNRIYNCTPYQVTAIGENNPNAVYSNPFIYSGKGNEEYKSILPEQAAKLQGKAVVFITNAKYINGVLVTKNNIKDLYIQQQKENNHYLIRKLIVDPSSSYATNRWEKQEGDTVPETKVFGYLNMEWGSLSDENGNVNAQDVSLYGSSVVGIRMLVGLWNYRARLLRLRQFVDNSNRLHREASKKAGDEEADMPLDELNRSLLSLKDPNIKMFKILQPDNDDSRSTYVDGKYVPLHFTCVPLHLNDPNGYNAGVYMSQKELNLQIDYLNGILGFIEQRILQIEKNNVSSLLGDENNLIQLDSQAYKKLYKASAKLIVLNANEDVRLELNGEDNVSIAEISGGTITIDASKAIVLFLSRLYKIIAVLKYKALDNANFYSKMGNIKIGNEQIKLVHDENMLLILASSNSSRVYQGSYRTSLFLDIINTALHGRPRPYTELVLAFKVPFPKGVFYNLRYRKTEEGLLLSEFHEILNSESDMIVNAQVLPPTLSIQLPYSSNSNIDEEGEGEGEGSVLKGEDYYKNLWEQELKRIKELTSDDYISLSPSIPFSEITSEEHLRETLINAIEDYNDSLPYMDFNFLIVEYDPNTKDITYCKQLVDHLRSVYNNGDPVIVGYGEQNKCLFALYSDPTNLYTVKKTSSLSVEVLPEKAPADYLCRDHIVNVFVRVDKLYSEDTDLEVKDIVDTLYSYLRQFEDISYGNTPIEIEQIRNAIGDNGLDILNGLKYSGMSLVDAGVDAFMASILDWVIADNC